ncbi:MAG: RNA-protein complex protein Nop10 [Candidatus Thorarchaeota archaeon]|nr:MAG: RNA-protein complex protein Nop10 [Candidatus Thorarchaeota archaeon]
MTHLFKCHKCGEYTLNQVTCPKCGCSVSSPKPPKYSPQDKYGNYRRKAKQKARELSTE